MQTLLKHAGHTVLLCGDGAEGLEVIKKERPDLIITDLITPGIDGYDLARAVRAYPPTASTPIIMQTAHYLESEVRQLAAQIGIQEVMLKPFEPQAFLDAVAKAMGDKAALERSEDPVPGTEFYVQHLELVTTKLHEKVRALEATYVELARANQHKSEFLDSMSHELRTQLSAILGFSELLSDAAPGKFDEPTKKKFLAQINSSGRYLMGLVDDILDLSKIEAGQMVLKIEDVSINDAVRSVLGTMESLAAKKSIRLEADVATAGRVPADLGKLKQMLINLVSNAVKFTPAGGRVTISVHRAAEAVEISVTDTGIGIDDSDRKHLFEEFRQLGSGSEKHGTGLGLAITKRFVELHGGQIMLVSQLGKGSVFTLRLPLEQSVLQAPLRVPAANGSR
jgi:signal transduction histidine kinase